MKIDIKRYQTRPSSPLGILYEIGGKQPRKSLDFMEKVCLSTRIWSALLLMCSILSTAGCGLGSDLLMTRSQVMDEVRKPDGTRRRPIWACP